MAQEKSSKAIPMSSELREKFWKEILQISDPFVPREDDWEGSIESFVDDTPEKPLKTERLEVRKREPLNNPKVMDN